LKTHLQVSHGEDFFFFKKHFSGQLSFWYEMLLSDIAANQSEIFPSLTLHLRGSMYVYVDRFYATNERPMTRFVRVVERGSEKYFAELTDQLEISHLLDW
jgi:hypothetical protein